jgi:DNA polymerase-3 subunit gamma/tau
MSLYLEHRPTEWEQIIGNEEVIQSLQNMLKKGNPPHTYLLVGGTGCGKTTIARILAKELGSLGNDYREINSADFRGIDSIREIIQNCKYRPLEGKCKVYMIDECHKLTTDAQNAMLKILEDTPDHVYFILATTDPQKLLSTVKGRSVILTVNALSDMEMTKLLKKVIKAEGDSVEKEVIEQIIQDSQGHPRNALQILEKVLNTDPEDRLEAAKQMAAQENEAIELCRVLLAGGGWKKCGTILEGLKGQEAESIRRVVLGYCQSILLKADNERAALIIEQFMAPLYDVGFPGLVFNCYAVTKS